MPKTIVLIVAVVTILWLGLLGASAIWVGNGPVATICIILSALNVAIAVAITKGMK